MSKSLEEYSREELIEEIKSLKKQKKFGLVWEDKPEKVVKDCETKLPVVKEVEEKAIENAPGEPTNIIIEGDNYHALSVLNYTHAGKVDVIYIDPPYNTENREFIYNDCRVDAEDSFRHSKWLSFMKKRLELARNLLKDSGVIFVSIDEHEYATLKLLMDEVFCESFLANITWDKRNPKGNSNTISSVTEYILCYANNKECIEELKTVKENADVMMWKAKQLYQKCGKSVVPECIIESIKLGANINKNDFAKQYELKDANRDFNKWLKVMPFSEGEKAYKNIDEKGDLYRPVSMAAPKDSKNKYSLIHPVTGKACPVPKTGWRNKKDTMDKLLENNEIIFGVDEKTIPNRKYLLKDYRYQTLSDLFAYAGNGIDDLISVVPGASFDNPKPLFIINKIIRAYCKSDAVILDFFAGSGTTGQSVMELNKEDGGHRQFILVTNNENQIAEKVTYPRIETVITGIRPDGTKYSDGIPANLRYFKTDFVEKGKTTDDTREALITECCDMIRIRENAFEHVASTPEYRFYKNDKIFVPIIFDQFAIAETWEKVEELNKDKLPVHCYNFSYNRHANEEEIPEDTELEWTACSIPETVLEVYRKIFRKKEV